MRATGERTSAHRSLPVLRTGAALSVLPALWLLRRHRRICQSARLPHYRMPYRSVSSSQAEPSQVSVLLQRLRCRLQLRVTAEVGSKPGAMSHATVQPRFTPRILPLQLP